MTSLSITIYIEDQIGVRALVSEDNVRNSFPVVVCIVGAIADFAVWAWLRNFKVRDKPAAALAHLSREERQRRVTIASRIVFGSAWFLLAAAGLLWWLGNR